MRTFLFPLFVALLWTQSLVAVDPVSLDDCSNEEALQKAPAIILTKKFTLYDLIKKRPIPVVVYECSSKKPKRPTVIISPGYGVEPQEYSFIANALCAHGHRVISIQHILKKDPKLPRKGNLRKTRRPFWEQGVKNIRCVMENIKTIDQSEPIILLGHSHGGDISMFYAKKFPHQVKKVISLDSLRSPHPPHIPTLSLRALDTKADPGILDGQNVCIRTIQAKHIHMCDRGPQSVKQAILSEILVFLEAS